MRSIATIVFLALITAAGTALAAPGWRDAPARYPQRHSDRAERAVPERGNSLDDAVARVRRQTGGRILSAQTVDDHGRRVHRIKVLTQDYRVRVFEVDANGR